MIGRLSLASICLRITIRLRYSLYSAYKRLRYGDAAILKGHDTVTFHHNKNYLLVTCDTNKRLIVISLLIAILLLLSNLLNMC